MKTRKYKDRDDATLLKEAKAAVAVEFAAVSNVVEYIMEVELRNLHLTRGFDSMFTFCMDYFGYSRAEAQLRLQAARLGHDVPEVCEKIESGEISLSVAAAAQSTFRKENQKRRQTGERPLSREQKQNSLLALEHCTQDQADDKLAEMFGFEKPKKKAWIEIDDDLAAKLKELKGLYAHKNFSGDLTKLVKIMADVALAQARKNKPKAASTAKPRDQQKPKTSLPQKTLVSGLPSMATSTHSVDAPLLLQANRKSRSRYISIKVKREVWRQAEGRCTYIDPITGKRCNGTHGLQIDHIQEFARGGTHDVENLRLMCGAHNRFRNMQI